jgi:hypothetical protein
MPNGNGRAGIVAQLQQNTTALQQWRDEQVQFIRREVGHTPEYFLGAEPVPGLDKDFDESHYTIAGLRHAVTELAEKQAAWKKNIRDTSISYMRQGYVNQESVNRFFTNAGLEAYMPRNKVTADVNVQMYIPQTDDRGAAKRTIMNALEEALRPYAEGAGTDAQIHTAVTVHRAM